MAKLLAHLTSDHKILGLYPAGEARARDKGGYPSKIPLCFEQILNYFKKRYTVDLTEYPIISKF